MTETVKYRVLARKYRPSTFSDLIGQEALVRTLSNAINSGRIAQSYILTGIRGVGKTTSARIIAKALNCTGVDGKGSMTTNPCGVCENCRAISEDRHVDVQEIDAASNTQVDNIREIIQSARYNPVSARFKIYIIDEVHMLSKSAFNALLKLLEEPPERVKFIFATTEIRKVPLTILSRCQRFDLRRVSSLEIANFFKKISEKEEIEISDEALQIIAKSADGSVRDGLSLLDQAIAHSGGKIDSNMVRSMLGLADRSVLFSLFESLMEGDTLSALKLFNEQHLSGADPLSILNDLLDIVHWLTKIKISPILADDISVPEIERIKGKELSDKLSLPILNRVWQLLLKGVGEIKISPSPFQAMEMLLIRISYASEVPLPIDLVKEIKKKSLTSDLRNEILNKNIDNKVKEVSLPIKGEVGSSSVSKEEGIKISTLSDISALAKSKGEMMLGFNIESFLHQVKISPGYLEIRPDTDAPRDIVSKLKHYLKEWTGEEWEVIISSEEGEETLRHQKEERDAHLKDFLVQDPLVESILNTFPGSIMKEAIPTKEEGGEIELSTSNNDLKEEE